MVVPVCQEVECSCPFFFYMISLILFVWLQFQTLDLVFSMIVFAIMFFIVLVFKVCAQRGGERLSFSLFVWFFFLCVCLLVNFVSRVMEKLPYCMLDVVALKVSFFSFCARCILL